MLSSTPAAVKETSAEIFWTFPLFTLLEGIPCGARVWFWKDPLFEEMFPSVMALAFSNVMALFTF